MPRSKLEPPARLSPTANVLDEKAQTMLQKQALAAMVIRHGKWSSIRMVAQYYRNDTAAKPCAITEDIEEF